MSGWTTEQLARYLAFISPEMGENPMEAPKCKLCETRHWGTCADHEAKGSLSARLVAPVTKTVIATVRRVDKSLVVDNSVVDNPRRSVRPNPAPVAVEQINADLSKRGLLPAAAGIKRSRGRPAKSDEEKSDRAVYYREQKRRKRAEAKAATKP